MPHWAKLTLKILGGLIGGVLLLAIIAVVVLTQTDWGRERIRGLALDQLRGSVNGIVQIGEIGGNLLSGATLNDVVITDSAGAPFLEAERISLDYSLSALLSQKVLLSDVRLIDPTIVLNQPPGGEWNFARIFPSDTTAQDTTQGGGFGSWVRIEDFSVVNGRLLTRLPWEPDSTLTGTARDSAIAVALSPESRPNVVRVEGGYQSIYDFRELDARMPALRLAHPDSADILVDVDSLSTEAYLFRPPAAPVRNLAGRFMVAEDSIRFQDLRLMLPGSELAGEGAYARESGGLRAALAASPIRLADLQWLRPTLPDSGAVNFQAVVVRTEERTHLEIEDLDARIEEARLAGHTVVQFGDSLRLGDTDLEFAGIDTRLIQRLAPDAEVPVEGTARGRVTLAGTPGALEVDGRIAFDQEGAGTSELVADGLVGTTGEGFRARNLRLRLEPLRVALVESFRPDLAIDGTLTGGVTLSGSNTDGFEVDGELVHRAPSTGVSRLLADGRVEIQDGFAARGLILRLDPLQVALARAFSPDLPLGGFLTGRATVSGSADTRFAADLDLTHEGPTGTTQLVGDARAVFGEPMAFRADLRAPTLSLATLGQFAPAAELQGEASGRLFAEGTLNDLALTLDLDVANGGGIAARGQLDLAGEPKRYDVETRFSAFDAAALSARAPETSLTGTALIQGRGTELASANALIDLDLTGARVDLPQSQADSAAVDAARLLVRLSDGLLQIEQGLVQLASAEAQLGGSFGLVEGRSGTLRYEVAVDSLSDFAGYLPPDTTAVQPRPVEQARRIALARADSLRIARETEVERAATGQPAEPRLQMDTIPPLRRDSLAGSIQAEGVVAGNLERFDLRGTAALENLIAAGNAVQNGRLEYAWEGAGTERSQFALDAAFDSLYAAGFAFDSVTTEIGYTGATDDGTGTARVAIFQDPNRDYRFRTDYRLELDRQELRLDDVALRFDTTFWASAQPGTLSWGEGGIEVETLELRSPDGGRIFVDGSLPTEGSADLELAIDRLPIQDVLALLQDTAQASGLLSFRADVDGPATAPTIVGQTALSDLAVGGTDVPELRASFGYADTQLELQAELLDQATRLLIADARLPVNLALQGVEGERMLDRPMQAEVRIDSLPLESLPQFTDAVSDVRGRVRGNVDIAGTFEEPEVDGVLNLDFGEITLVAAGVELQEAAGTLRIRQDSVFIDSLVARTREGPVRVAGALDITTPTEPAFDLALEARDALVLNNELGEVQVNADLAMQGPYEAVRITGNVNVREGTIYVPQSEGNVIDLTDPALARAVDSLNVDPDALPQGNPLVDNLRVNVDVRVSRNTWARTADARVELYTPDDADPLHVEIDRAQDALVVRGVVSTNQGEYSLAGRRFELSSGTVTFLGNPEFDPLLQLTAIHEVPQPGREALEIQINIGGNLSNVEIQLSSNAQPPLTQSDLISYLVFGRSSSSLLDQGSSGVTSGPENGQNLGALATQQLASLALGALVDGVATDLENEADAAGLDVVRIFPGKIPDEFAFDDYLNNVLRGTQYEAGKYLNRRLFLAAQGRFSTDTYPGMRVEYRTPAGFRWVTTWEPSYLPSEPSFATPEEVRQKRVFGLFLLWERRF